MNIDYITNLKRPVSAFIRLLYKAQQLELRYKLPPDNVLVEALHARCMGEPTMKKFRKLRHPYKSELVDRFWINIPITRFGTRLYRLYSIQRGGILILSSEESSDDTSCDSSDDPNDDSSGESSDGVNNLVARFAARSFNWNDIFDLLVVEITYHSLQ